MKNESMLIILMKAIKHLNNPNKYELISVVWLLLSFNYL